MHSTGIPDLSQKYPEVFAAFKSIGWKDERAARNKFQVWMESKIEFFGKTPIQVISEDGEESVISLLIAIAEGAYL
jgi:hypothetical protein